MNSVVDECVRRFRIPGSEVSELEMKFRSSLQSECVTVAHVKPAQIKVWEFVYISSTLRNRQTNYANINHDINSSHNVVEPALYTEHSVCRQSIESVR
jgi:hypothetical protein